MSRLNASRSLARPLGLGLALVLGSLVCASCGGNGPSPPEAYINSTLGGPQTGTSMCNLNGPGATFVHTGTVSNPTPNGGAFTVTCNVQQKGSGFEVALYMVQDGVGSIEIQSAPGATISMSGATPQTVRGSFTSGDNSYSSDSCSLSFPGTAPGGMVDGFQVNPEMGVYPGRIWGILDCPMVNEMDGTSVCQASAVFLFQFCDD